MIPSVQSLLAPVKAMFASVGKYIGEHPGEFTILVLTVLLVFLAIPPGIVYLRKLLQKQQKPFPFELVELNKLALRARLLSATGSGLEPYISRSAISAQLDNKGLPPQKVLLHGSSGVGKTREALEILRRMHQRQRYNVYFAQGRIEEPTELPGLPYRDVVLFVDDLVPPRDLHKRGNDERDSGPEDEEAGDRLAQNLRDSIRVFETTSRERVHVILTCQTANFNLVQRGLSRYIPDLKVVEIVEPSESEKEQYIHGLAQHLGVAPLSAEVVKEFAAESGESLRDIYSFFDRKREESKTHLDISDIATFKEDLKYHGKNRFLALPKPAREIVAAVATLDEFSMPQFTYLAVELAYRRGRPSILGRRRYKAALLQLHRRRWLKVDGGQVYCSEYNEHFEKSESSDERLDWLAVASDAATTRRSRALDRYIVLSALAKAFHRNHRLHEAVHYSDRIFALANRLLPQPVNETRSNVLLHKGLNLVAAGPQFRATALNVFREALKQDPSNRKAKHALASGLLKSGQPDAALELLKEITAAASDDILAHRTIIELHIKSGRDHQLARRTYRTLSKLIRNNDDLPPVVRISAELSCVRFAAHVAEVLHEKGEHKKAGRREDIAGTRFAELIANTPPSEPKLAAVIRNVYGGFLYDVLAHTDAAVRQFEESLALDPDNNLTRHKLATIYVDEAEVRTSERQVLLHKAQQLYRRVIETDPHQYASRLSLAILEGKTLDSGRLDANQFWGAVKRVYARYQQALQAEGDGQFILHNAIAHHATGCFLWQAEAQAHKRGFPDCDDAVLPAADTELKSSLEICESFGPNPPRNVARQLLLAYYTLGTYYITVASGSAERIHKGQELITKAVGLRKTVGGQFSFESHNSFVQSFVGKLLLAMNENAEAKTSLQAAVRSYPQNWRGWWFLGRVHERDNDFAEAIHCFETAAEGQASPALYGQLQAIAEGWGTVSTELITLPPGVSANRLTWGSGVLNYKGEMTEHTKFHLLELSEDRHYHDAIYRLFEQSRATALSLSQAGLSRQALAAYACKWARRGYKLDPVGKLNAKNLTDYAYCLFRRLCKGSRPKRLKPVLALFTFAYERYLQMGMSQEANFPLWYAARCRELTTGRIENNVLEQYIEATMLRSSVRGFIELRDAVRRYADWEEAIRIYLTVADRHPERDIVFQQFANVCCLQVWVAGNTLSTKVIADILHFCERHKDRTAANGMLGVVLQRNRDNFGALQYLVQFEHSKDSCVLRSLLDCYLGLKQPEKAKETCRHLYPLLNAREKKNLQAHAAKHEYCGVNCASCAAPLY